MSPSITLRFAPLAARPALVTGASGYVGCMAASALLAAGAPELLLVLRNVAAADEVRRTIRLELEAEGIATGDLEHRLRVVSWADLETGEPLKRLSQAGAWDVVHCAGSVSYFEDEALELANVALTERVLRVAGDGGAARFVFVSTAFSCGYVQGAAAEELHAEPEGDPTSYTRSKRKAEHIVARGGLPYLILRPSVLIGDSRDGRYAGKRYGLYQLWMGTEKYLTKRYFPVCHAVAPDTYVNFIHQNGFKAALAATMAHLPDDRVMHVVSRTVATPSMREAQKLWFERTLRPQEIHYYPHVDDVPVRTLDSRQRALIALASVNLQIASRHWAFSSATLDALIDRGLAFPHVTQASLQVCQERFVRTSERLREYHAAYGHLMPQRSRTVDMTPTQGEVSHA